jgi:hypothetical protein
MPIEKDAKWGLLHKAGHEIEDIHSRQPSTCVEAGHDVLVGGGGKGV